MEYPEIWKTLNEALEQMRSERDFFREEARKAIDEREKDTWFLTRTRSLEAALKRRDQHVANLQAEIDVREDTLVRLARLWREMGEADEAMKLARRASQAAPKRHMARLGLHDCLDEIAEEYGDG